MLFVPKGQIKGHSEASKKRDTNTEKTETVESLHTFLLPSSSSSSSCTLRCVKWCNVPTSGCNMGDLVKLLLVQWNPCLGSSCWGERNILDWMVDVQGRHNTWAVFRNASSHKIVQYLVDFHKYLDISPKMSKYCASTYK